MAPAEFESSATARGLRVLLVEDEPGQAFLTERHLRSSKNAFDVVHQATLAGALEVLESSTVHAVLLDLGLPDAEGISALQTIRQKQPSVPIVVLTGLDDDDVGALALREGAQDYLLKNDITDTTLARSIRYAIERRTNETLHEHLMHSERLAAIGQLAAGVAHEINNPGAFLLANTNLCSEISSDLEQKLKQLPEIVARSGATDGTVISEALKTLGIFEDLGAISDMMTDNEGGLRRITSIVRNLGLFSQIDVGEVQLADVNEIIHGACDLVHSDLRHRATLTIDLQDVPPIACHRGRITQVIINLLIRATHAIDDDGVESNRIDISTRHTSGRINIAIADSGRRIGTDDLPQVFESFYSSTPKSQGAALGLSICRDIIGRHRGEITVERDAESGTTFRISIPENTGLDASKAPAAKDSEAVTSGRGRILIVDDEPSVRNAFTRLLSRTHDVVAVAAANEALEYLRADAHFGVILCDLMMPGMDGADFYAALEDVAPQLRERTVFISGGAVTSRVQAFVRDADVVVIDKPVPRDTLLKTIRNAMASSG